MEEQKMSYDELVELKLIQSRSVIIFLTHQRNHRLDRERYIQDDKKGPLI